MQAVQMHFATPPRTSPGHRSLGRRNSAKPLPELSCASFPEIKSSVRMGGGEPRAELRSPWASLACRAKVSQRSASLDAVPDKTVRFFRMGEVRPFPFDIEAPSRTGQDYLCRRGQM